MYVVCGLICGGLKLGKRCAKNDCLPVLYLALHFLRMHANNLIPAVQNLYSRMLQINHKRAAEIGGKRGKQKTKPNKSKHISYISIQINQR